MKSEVLSFFPLPSLTLVGLLIFFSFFLAILYWVFHKARLPLYQYLETLPLEDTP